MTTATSHYTGEERRKRIFAIVGASSGNLVEWFDFYVYAFCAIYFAPAFFPSTTPRSLPRSCFPQSLNPRQPMYPEKVVDAN